MRLLCESFLAYALLMPKLSDPGNAGVGLPEMGHPRIKLRSADEDLAAHPVVGQRPGRVVQVLPERPVLYFSFFSASFAASLISVDGSPVARFRINGITSRSPSFASPSTLSSLTYGELSLTARRSASLIFCLDRGSLTLETFCVSSM